MSSDDELGLGDVLALPGDPAAPVALAGGPPPAALGAGAPAAAAEDESDDDDLNIGEALAVPGPIALKYKRRTPEVMQRARDVKAKIVGIAKAQAEEKKRVEVEQTLDMAVSCLPAVAKIVGRSGSQRQVAKIREAEMSNFMLLSRAVHLPTTTKDLSLGIKHKRLVAAGADLILQRQSACVLVCLPCSVWSGHAGL